jgi:hypothetical protein
MRTRRKVDRFNEMYRGSVYHYTKKRALLLAIPNRDPDERLKSLISDNAIKESIIDCINFYASDDQTNVMVSWRRNGFHEVSVYATNMFTYWKDYSSMHISQNFIHEWDLINSKAHILQLKRHIKKFYRNNLKEIV